MIKFVGKYTVATIPKQYMTLMSSGLGLEATTLATVTECTIWISHPYNTCTVNLYSFSR